jgi:hypothetical protein
MHIGDGTALAVEFPIGTLHVRIGDLRVSQRQGVQGSALRGVLVEITSPTMDGKSGDKASEQDEKLLRELLEAIVLNSKVEIKMNDVKLLARYTEKAHSKDGPENAAELDGGKGKKQSQWALAELYMEMLRTRT